METPRSLTDSVLERVQMCRAEKSDMLSPKSEGTAEEHEEETLNFKA